MSFSKIQYAPFVILAIIVFIYLFNSHFKKYKTWVDLYWFKSERKKHFWGRLFLYCSLIFLLFSSLDLRGPVEKVENESLKQKTVLLIDSSLSMSVDDIRPSRFEKAILIARHFLKNAVGHQISVVIFSDTHKQIVPFTDDIDLLDARVSSLLKNHQLRGGSNIVSAIEESLSYFKIKEGKGVDPRGNIIIFSDAEEHTETNQFNIPDTVNVAFIALGTRKGGAIPLRSSSGKYLGVKRYGGKEVISKLNEDVLKKLSSKINHFKYWIVQSYSLPTEEILSFFKNSLEVSKEKGTIEIRPVYGHRLLIPFILLFILSVLLRQKVFICLLFFYLTHNELSANEEEEKKIPPQILEKIEKLKSGDLSNDQVLKIGEDFLKNNDPKRAAMIYDEYLDPDSASIEQKLNSVTSNLASGQIAKASHMAKKLLKDDSVPKEMKKNLRDNIIKALASQEKQQSQDGKDGEKKDEKQQGDENKDSAGKGNDDKEKKKDKNNDKEGKEKDKKDKKDKKGKGDKDKEKDKKDQKLTNKLSKEKQEELEKKRRQMKIPAMIKQIMGQDRQLQKQFFDTSTEQKDTQKKRDW